MNYKPKIADIKICVHTAFNNTKKFHKHRKFKTIYLKAIILCISQMSIILFSKTVKSVLPILLCSRVFPFFI